MTDIIQTLAHAMEDPNAPLEGMVDAFIQETFDSLNNNAERILYIEKGGIQFEASTLQERNALSFYREKEREFFEREAPKSPWSESDDGPTSPLPEELIPVSLSSEEEDIVWVSKPEE